MARRRAGTVCGDWSVQLLPQGPSRPLNSRIEDRQPHGVQHPARPSSPHYTGWQDPRQPAADGGQGHCISVCRGRMRSIRPAVGAAAARAGEHDPTRPCSRRYDDTVGRLDTVVSRSSTVSSLPTASSYSPPSALRDPSQAGRRPPALRTLQRPRLARFSVSSAMPSSLASALASFAGRGRSANARRGKASPAPPTDNAKALDGETVRPNPHYH